MSPDIAQACGDRGAERSRPPPTSMDAASTSAPAGVTVVLIETPAGLVLIDSGPKEATAHVLKTCVDWALSRGR